MSSPQSYQLIGWINSSQEEKVYMGKYAGSYFFRLSCSLENKEGIENIFVFVNLIEQETIWQTIKKGGWPGKKYLFFCVRRRNQFALTNWQEL